MYMTNDSFVSVTDPPGQCDAPLDLVFVIDSSGSINFAGAGNWDRVLKFVNGHRFEARHRADGHTGGCRAIFY